jgi:hypothetical protein
MSFVEQVKANAINHFQQENEKFKVEVEAKKIFDRIMPRDRE